MSIPQVTKDEGKRQAPIPPPYTVDDAAALLAIAGQMERLADGVEEALAALIATATGPGKTHSVNWFMERDRVNNPPFTGQDGFE